MQTLEAIVREPATLHPRDSLHFSREIDHEMQDLGLIRRGQGEEVGCVQNYDMLVGRCRVAGQAGSIERCGVEGK